MRTVKEISDLTGISVRTLHYYYEIGLLKPTDKSEAGYRLYDDKALETLQQILFFREFDIPLKEIKAVLDNPALDGNQILQVQKKMLLVKKERIENLIANIERILKGDSKMDFEVFSKSELEDVFNSMITNMSETQKTVFEERYGSMAAWREKFLEDASSGAAQKNFETVVEWYGSKEKALEASKNPNNSDLVPECQKHLEEIMKKLSKQMGQDIASTEVQELISEYDVVSKQMYQMEDISALMLELATAYQTKIEIQKMLDTVYGEGVTEFLGKAIAVFYSAKQI